MPSVRNEKEKKNYYLPLNLKQDQKGTLNLQKLKNLHIMDQSLK